MKFNKKRIMIAVMTILVLATMSLIGLTYAYYQTKIIENDNETSVSVTSEILELTYADGSENIVGENILPGFEATKKFTVKNTGNVVLEDYVVYFDDVTNEFERTEDWTYTLTCSSNSGSCSGATGTIPVGESIIVTNDIPVGATHSYELTVKYAITSEDQTEDMGKLLSAKINIADKTKYNPYSDNTETLAYNIVNNEIANTDEIQAKYRISPLTKVGYEPSNEYSLTGFGSTYSTTISSSYYLTYADDIEFNMDGSFNLVDPTVEKYSAIYNNLTGKYIVSTSGSASSSMENTTNLYTIYEVISATSTGFTYTGYDSAGEGESKESTLTMAEDDYGTSYYFRGGVTNNYLTFDNMCWRIVRIQGDGSIKLVLADDESGCSSTTATKVGSAFIAYSDYGNTDSSADFFTTSTVSLKNALTAFLNGNTYNNGSTTYTYDGFSTSALSKIKLEDWCVGDGYTARRLEVNRDATFKCVSGESFSSKIGSLTADEITYAGGNYNTDNQNYYLLENATNIDPHWTISQVDATGAFAITWAGALVIESYTSGAYVRPAVVLNPGVEITSGTGTITNPYVISS